MCKGEHFEMDEWIHFGLCYDSANKFECGYTVVLSPLTVTCITVPSAS